MFDPDNLCVLSYARARKQPHGFTHWYYWSDDPKETLIPNFFAGAADLMQPGDVVFVAGQNGTMQLAVAAAHRAGQITGAGRTDEGRVEVRVMSHAAFGAEVETVKGEAA